MEDQRIVFFQAVSCNQLAVVTQMLRDGALVDGRDSTGGRHAWTALMLAALQDQDAMAELLLAHGADVNARSEDEWTPLLNAVRKRNLIMVKLLVKHGADVNATRFGASPLFASDGLTLDLARELKKPITNLISNILRDAGAVSLAPCPICSSSCFVCNSQDMIYDKLHCINLVTTKRYGETYNFAGQVHDSDRIGIYRCFACQCARHVPPLDYSVNLAKYSLTDTFEYLPDKLYSYGGMECFGPSVTLSNTRFVDRKMSGEKIKGLQELQWPECCPLCKGLGGLRLDNCDWTGTIFEGVASRDSRRFIDWLLENGISALTDERTSVEVDDDEPTNVDPIDPNLWGDLEV